MTPSPTLSTQVFTRGQRVVKILVHKPVAQGRYATVEYWRTPKGEVRITHISVDGYIVASPTVECPRDLRGPLKGALGINLAYAFGNDSVPEGWVEEKFPGCEHVRR